MVLFLVLCVLLKVIYGAALSIVGIICGAVCFDGVIGGGVYVLLGVIGGGVCVDGCYWWCSMFLLVVFLVLSIAL